MSKTEQEIFIEIGTVKNLIEKQKADSFYNGFWLGMIIMTVAIVLMMAYMVIVQ